MPCRGKRKRDGRREISAASDICPCEVLWILKLAALAPAVHPSINVDVVDRCEHSWAFSYIDETLLRVRLCRRPPV